MGAQQQNKPAIRFVISGRSGSRIQSRFRCPTKSTLAPAAWAGSPRVAGDHAQSQPYGEYHALAGCIPYAHLWQDAKPAANQPTGRCQCEAGGAPQRFTLYPKRRRPLASILVTKHRLIDKELNMHTGMLWFDNSQTALNIKIQKAVDYYHKKYGRTPDLCLVHPSMLDTQERNQRQLEDNKLTVRPYRPVLPGHIWIGIEDKN